MNDEKDQPIEFAPVEDYPSGSHPGGEPSRDPNGGSDRTRGPNREYVRKFFTPFTERKPSFSESRPSMPSVSDLVLWLYIGGAVVAFIGLLIVTNTEEGGWWFVPLAGVIALLVGYAADQTRREEHRKAVQAWEERKARYKLDVKAWKERKRDWENMDPGPVLRTLKHDIQHMIQSSYDELGLVPHDKAGPKDRDRAERLPVPCWGPTLEYMTEETSPSEPGFARRSPVTDQWYFRVYDIAIIQFHRDQLCTYHTRFDILNGRMYGYVTEEWNYRHVVGLSVKKLPPDHGTRKLKSVHDDTAIDLEQTAALELFASNGEKIKVTIGGNMKTGTLGGGEAMQTAAMACIKAIRGQVRQSNSGPRKEESKISAL